VKEKLPKENNRPKDENLANPVAMVVTSEKLKTQKTQRDASRVTQATTFRRIWDIGWLDIFQHFRQLII
jgi:hypothetical protein